jgi:predicted lactoylglutathione lyase
MDDETLNLSIRKFLKMVGVSSQREIEHAVAKAAEAGGAPDAFPATMTLEVPALGLKVKFEGTIALR